MAANDSEAQVTSEDRKGYVGNGDRIEDYSDQSSSYWPEGWNFQRYCNCEVDQLLALGNAEIEKLQAGFRDVLGEVGNYKLVRALEEWEGKKQQSQQDAQTPRDQRDQQRQQPSSSVGPTISLRPDFSAHEPNWLMFCRDWQCEEWGFTAFKVGVHEGDEQWTEFKRKFDEIVRLHFHADSQFPNVTEAGENFRIKWIEDPELKHADVKQIQQRFAEIQSTLPIGMPRQLCLAATPQAVSRLLQLPLPTVGSQRWRPDPPYILAVSASGDPGLEEGHEEREWFQASFKVSVETLVDELWVVLEGLEWPVRRITRGIRGTHLVDGKEVASEEPLGSGLDDVWWSSAPSPDRLRKRRQEID